MDRRDRLAIGLWGSPKLTWLPLRGERKWADWLSRPEQREEEEQVPEERQ